MITKATKKSVLFPPSVVSQSDVRDGLEYGMIVDTRAMPAPNVPILDRSSLGQQYLKHRYQITRYFSKLRNFGFRPDYPVFKGLQIVPTKPEGLAATPRPVLNRAGLLYPNAVSQGGVMGAPRRFAKALKNPINTYTPPEY